MPFRQDARPGLRATGEGSGLPTQEPERRQLTVLFCDLVGSTALSQSMDPEDLIEVLTSYRSTCNNVIASHGGHVSRYTGDGILALFGYPVAQEDVTERAAYAALAVVQAVSGLKVPHRDDVRLAVRIGVATGLVIVGEMIGDGPTRDEAIIGATPNLATRLQTLASPNTVVISDDTRKLLGDAFEYRSMGEHQLQGFEEPVQAWRVVGVSEVETRFDAAHASGLTPLVNRRAEIDLMLRLWEETKASSSRVLLMEGEAGIGKSRLIKALRDRIAKEAHSALQFQCSPHYRHTALYPFLRHIERLAGFERDDTPDIKRNKLSDMFGADVLPVFGRLLSVHQLPADDNVVELNAQRQRDLTFATLLGRLRRLAAELPVLIVIEDVHWMDPTSIELLTYLIDHTDEEKVFFVVTFRPEFEPVCVDRQHVSFVKIEALDECFGRTLAKSVLGEEAAAPHLVAQIVERTGGMPLFIEEVAKSLLEAGSSVADARQQPPADAQPMSVVPISLRDSLMARIDQLGEARVIAQIGAVIGQEFTHSLMERIVLESEPDLEPALARLVDSGLLLRQDKAKEIRYVFKHALLRDAVYDSLLNRRRERLHARIAGCLEDDFPDIVANRPELLAEHCSEAGFAERAIRYWQRAGERAGERCENLEARNHFRNALELLDDLKESKANKELELSLLIRLGPVEIAIGGPGSKESNDVYQRAVALCDDLPNSPLHFVAHWGQWRTSRTYLIKRERADRLSGVTGHLGDPGFSLQAHHCQWAVLFNLGLHAECCAHVDHGIDIYEAGDFRSHAMIYGGHDPAVCGHGQAALSLWLLGKPEAAAVQMDKALAVAGSLSHVGSLLHAFEIALMYHRFRQDVGEVEKLAERMIALSREEEFTALEVKGELFQAWAGGRRGKVEQATSHLAAGIEKLRSIDANEDLPFYFDMLAECYALGDRIDDGLQALDSAIGEVDKTASRFWAAELYRRKGELLDAKGSDDAEKVFEDALTTAREQGARMLELRAATNLALWLGSRGEAKAAEDLLSPIYGGFTEGLDTIDLAAAKACLLELTSGSGQR